jgi:hypothetical protein
MADKITCFSPAGVEYANNTKCPNSDSCCQTTEQCRPDRLCESNKDPDILVGALCANYPWTYATCATICTYGVLHCRSIPYHTNGRQSTTITTSRACASARTGATAATTRRPAAWTTRGSSSKSTAPRLGARMKLLLRPLPRRPRRQPGR